MTKMKVWKLKPADHLPDYKSPWFPIGGKVLGMVVVAATEDDARQIAHDNGGDENRFAICPWKDSQLSTCVEIPKDCKPCVILQDYVDYERP